MTVDLQLTQSIRRAARVDPEGIATIDGERRRTHADFAHRVARAAGGLRALGVEVGDRVSALALNCDGFLEHFAACWWSGAVPAPLNIRWSDAEIVHAIELARPSVLVVDPVFSERVDALVAQGTVAARVVSFGENGSAGACATWGELAGGDHVLADQGFGGDDAAALLFTGGTTARPKAVELSHRNLVVAGVGMRAMGCATSARLLHATPLFHMGGMQMSVAHWLGGGTHVVVPAFDPATVARSVEEHEVTDLLLAPTMLEMLLRLPNLATFDLRSLRQIVYGTSPMTPDLLRRAMDALPNARFAQGYGMSETAMTIMLPPQFHALDDSGSSKLASIGVPSPLVEIRVVDPIGDETGPGEAGELLVRGASVMKGYWNEPEMTARVIDGDGWLHTGDGARLDDDGFVYLTDRIKDMIITGGENVYSVEVENALCTFPGVAMVAVIGVADSVWGEAVHAVVVPVDGADIDTAALITHARSLLTPYKVPRAVSIVDELPLSATGKVLKNTLREKFGSAPAEP